MIRTKENRRCGNGSNTAHMTMRNEIRESKARENTCSIYAWCAWSRKNCARANFCNLQSIFSPRHACMHKKLPIMRHPTYLHTYMRRVVTLSGSRTCIKNVLEAPGNARIGIRDHAQEILSQNAVSSLRRRPGPWLNILTHVISSPCDRENLVIPNQNRNEGIIFSLAHARKPMSCKFEYVSCRGKSPRFIIIGRNSREKLNVQTCSLMDVISLAHFRKRGRVHMILNDNSDAESSPHLAIVKLINERHKDGKWQ